MLKSNIYPYFIVFLLCELTLSLELLIRKFIEELEKMNTLLVFLLVLVGVIFSYREYLVYKREKIRLSSKEISSDEKRLFQLVENSKDVIYHLQIDPEPKFVYLSPSLDTWIGEGTVEESMKDPLRGLGRIHPEDREMLTRKFANDVDFSEELIMRWMDNKGNYQTFGEYVTPIYDNDRLIAIQGVMRNIDEKLKLQQELEYRVTHDALTGIHNRAYFDHHFTQFNEQQDISVGILLCDLDDLKYVNDQYGHKAGDVLLKETANVLNGFSASGVRVARLGGDEFVLLVERMSAHTMEALIADIYKELHAFNETTASNPIHLSIGYACTDHSLGRMTELFKQADQDMYKNKAERKKRMSFRTASAR